MFGNASSYRIRPLGPEECLLIYGRSRCFQRVTNRRRRGLLSRWDRRIRAGRLSLPRTTRTCPASGLACTREGFDFMRLSHQGEGMTSNSQPLVDGYLAGEEQNRLVAAAPRVSGPIEPRYAMSDSNTTCLGFITAV